MSRGLKILLGAVVAVVLLVIGGWVLYATVLNDPEDKLTTQDLDERLSDTTPTVTGPAVTGPAVTDPGAPVVTDAPASTEAPGSTATPTTPGTDGSTSPAGTTVDGTWTTVDGTEVGYRVKETLSGVATEGVGRTSEVEGSLTIDGTQVTDAEFVVDVASITSDESRRDSQFAGRIMETSEFPTATFTLTAPIELGAVPAEGEQITASATGDLTLHGVTRSVTFDVTAQYENGKVGVLGNIPVVFADYDIDNPSFGPITTEDNGLLEILLVMAPA